MNSLKIAVIVYILTDIFMELREFICVKMKNVDLPPDLQETHRSLCTKLENWDSSELKSCYLNYSDIFCQTNSITFENILSWINMYCVFLLY
jgi:hypothetical protein